MKYFVYSRSKIVRAGSHEAFITKMRQTDNEQLQSNEAYMSAYANRRLLYDHVALNYTDETSFVQELIRHNLIKIIRKRTILETLFKVRR